MPYVDIIFNQLQKRKTEPTEAYSAIQNFQNISIIRNKMDDIVNEASNLCLAPPANKRCRGHNSIDQCVAAIEVCDIIISTAKSHFNFKDHLTAASLFFSEKSQSYSVKYRIEKLNSICSVYPNLEKERLKVELSVIYARTDCRSLNGAIALLKFIIRNNLNDTIPMTTAEAERCFSSLKHIKAFL